jgi:hypothetical protein
MSTWQYCLFQVKLPDCNPQLYDDCNKLVEVDVGFEWVQVLLPVLRVMSIIFWEATCVQVGNG